MASNEFTEEDKTLIEKDFADLYEVAKTRCADQNELDVVRKAFNFANEAHRGVRRRSGEPYILHPIAVAKIVVHDIGLGYKSIAAALLHDVVEDTDYTVDDIKLMFGDKIASLVDGLTKIKTVLDKEEKAKEKSLQAENFKRILLTLNDDVRVVLIKLADRLHNCRTIDSMPDYKRDKILSETMFIFIPLAHRLGLYGIKSEMEDIWLRFKEPEAFHDLTSKINDTLDAKTKEIDNFIVPISNSLTEAGFNFEILKRVKTPYSVWRKMNTRNISFDQIYDLYAVRIIITPEEGSTESERDMCYHVFSIITGIYRYKPDRVRDWVKHPKVNGYEALHCTLMSNEGTWIEVQIRTKRMDEIAEKGISAHWAYKQAAGLMEPSEMDNWLEKIKGILVNPDVNALELLDIIHRDLTSTNIFVFTPKGEQRTIQKGATALDFAYQIHTAIGNKAVAAKVNRRLVPLSTVLHTGDQVEIITTETSEPKKEWLDFVQTSKAKKVLFDIFKEEIASSKASKQSEKSKNSNILSRILKKSTTNASTSRFIFADCCHPIPGDPVTCFKNSDGTVTVHKKTCEIANDLASKYGNNIVSMSWGEISYNDEYLVRLSLSGIDRTGLLNEISRYVSLVMNANIRRLYLAAEDGVFDGYIELYIKDLEDLEKLTRRLEKIEGMKSVVRTDL